MRKLVLTLTVSTAALLGFNAAQAADAVEQIPAPPVATETFTPAPDWTGAYLGAAATYDWGRFGGGDYDASGFGGTVYAGYNFQSGSIVYGPEVDLSWADQKDGTVAAGVSGRENISGSVRGRVGYDMNPFLIYGTAGLAVGNHELKSAAGSDDKTSLGWTVGGGVEALVTDNLTARVEYRYTDYASQDYNLGGATVSRGFDDHSVKVGIGVKF